MFLTIVIKPLRMIISFFRYTTGKYIYDCVTDWYAFCLVLNIKIYEIFDQDVDHISTFHCNYI